MNLSDWRVVVGGILAVFSAGTFVGPTIDDVVNKQPEILKQTAVRLESQEEQIAAVTEAVKRNSESIRNLTSVIESWRPDTTSPIQFTANGSFFPDTHAGNTNNITWAVTRLREGCWVDELQVFFVDKEGVTQGYVVDSMPGVTIPMNTLTRVTYPIRVPEAMPVGRANVFVEVTYRCEDGFQTEIQSPYLTFDVLPAEE